MNYKTCWLTVNRACNLRCKWCYAQETGFKKENDMPLKMAKDLVDICSDIGIKHITLIGGEPTIYPNLLELIEYSRSKNMRCGFVTNGIALKDKALVLALIEKGMKSFSVSLKGENQDAFLSITGCDAFDTVRSGVENCLRSGATVTISMVLTKDNIPGFLEAVKVFSDLGVSNFRFSFCYEFNTSDEYHMYLSDADPREVIRKFVEAYPQLDKLTNHRFTLFQSYPMCLWDPQIIEQMRMKKQLSSVCQLLTKSGLLFDESGNIIPCNAMYKIKLGKFYQDFSNAKELIELSKSPSFVEAYTHFCGVPDKSCLDCEQLSVCGGGCVCQWTNYSFEEIMKR